MRVVRPHEKDFWDPEVFCQMMKIRPKAGGLVPFKLWSHQQILAKAMIGCYADQKWLCHVKPRQEGSSTFFTALAYQNAAFRTGCYAAILANTSGEKGAAKNLAKIAMRFHRTTPDEIRPVRDTQLKNHLRFPSLESELTIAGVKDAEPLRGDTVQFLLCTEVSAPQWRARGEDAFTSALNAVPDQYGMVIAESTPRHHGDQLHEIVLESEQPGSRWRNIFIPWTMIVEYSKTPHTGWNPREEVLDYANQHGLSESQAYWMETVGLPKCRNKLHKFRAEYPVSLIDCFGMAGEPIFNADQLSAWMKELDGNTNAAYVDHEYAQWEKPKTGHSYVISIDPAGSWAKRDFFGLVVFDLSTCSVVAEYTGHTTAGRMTTRAIKLAEEYNRAMIVVEANGIGEAVLSQLLEVYSYPYVFHRDASDSLRHGETKIPGWWSSTKSKASAISYLQDVIEDGSMACPSLRILRQLMAYRGQWDKLRRDSMGGHFDLVAALAMAVWVYYHEVQAGRIRGQQENPADLAAQNFQSVLDKINSRGEMEWNSPWGQHS